MRTILCATTKYLSMIKNILLGTCIATSAVFSANAQETIADAIADVYIDSIVSPSTRMEIERLINNGDATIDYNMRPDVVEESIRAGIGNRKLEEMMERERQRKCDRSQLCN